jgi:hypothetical protein
MLPIIKQFFAKAEGSIQGYLNPEELYRSIVTSFGSATSMGLLLLILQAVQTNAATIFPNPTVASLATGLLTLVIDLLRRQAQGSTPAPTPAPVAN